MEILIYFLVGIFILFIGTIIVFIYEKYQYDKMIKRLAEETTFERIEEIIQKDVEAIESGSFSGHFLRNILDHMEMWEQIRDCKNKNKI